MKSWVQNESTEAEWRSWHNLGVESWNTFADLIKPILNLKMQHPGQLLGNSSLTFRVTCGCAIMLIRPAILAAAIGTWVAHIHWDGPWNLEWRPWKLHRQVMTTYQNSIGKYSVLMAPKIVLSTRCASLSSFCLNVYVQEYLDVDHSHSHSSSVCLWNDFIFIRT